MYLDLLHSSRIIEICTFFRIVRRLAASLPLTSCGMSSAFLIGVEQTQTIRSAKNPRRSILVWSETCKDTLEECSRNGKATMKTLRMRTVLCSRLFYIHQCCETAKRWRSATSVWDSSILNLEAVDRPRQLSLTVQVLKSSRAGARKKSTISRQR